MVGKIYHAACKSLEGCDVLLMFLLHRKYDIFYILRQIRTALVISTVSKISGKVHTIKTKKKKKACDNVKKKLNNKKRIGLPYFSTLKEKRKIYKLHYK